MVKHRLFSNLLVILITLFVIIVPLTEQKNSKKKKQNSIEKANNSRFKGLFEQARLSTECRGLVHEELHE